MNVFRAKREREKRKRNEAQVSEWTGPVIFCEWNFPSGPLYVEIHSDGPIWSSRLGPTNVGWITSHPHGQFRSARLSLPADHHRQLLLKKNKLVHATRIAR